MATHPKKVKFTVKFTIHISRGERWFVAHCPELKGCVSQGKTIPSTIRNIADAMAAIVKVKEED